MRAPANALILSAFALVSAAQDFPKRILADERSLLATPFHVKPRDLSWIIPLGALTGLLIASDSHTMTAHIRSNPLAMARSASISNASLAGLVAIPAVMYGFGRLHENSRLEEGAVLAGESFVDSLIANEALKFTLRRERPLQDGARGSFFASSWTNASFPSTHAMLSWSVASAIAHRYPGWLTQTVVYSLAAASSLPRVTAERHFPSDVVVGGVLGWLIGRGVFRLRHTDWDPATFTPPPAPKSLDRNTPRAEFYAPEREGPPRPIGPLLVPMDSWVYPALLRLAALGYISDQATGIRPWTRVECMRQIGEAEEVLAYGVTRPRARNPEEALSLVRALREEFERDRGAQSYVELESLYGRYTAVTGRPLVDGYNFGQTVANDYGRPVSEGNNAIGGFSAEAVTGRVSFYTRGEFQHSPPFTSPAGRLKAIANQLEPVLGAAPGGVDRFRPVEMYAGIQLGGWSFLLGKQDLWWGPGEAGPLSFSNNSEPFYSFRVTSASPIVLPGPLSRLGTFRLDLIGGKLSGHQLPARPLVNGQKITWNLTKDIELGFTRWSLFDGAGVHGFTASSVVRNLLANGPTGAAGDPGDRKSGFDFRWRLPRWGVTLYSDFYADDEPSPLASPRRSGFSPGIYFASLPGLSRWDLRVEAPSTRLGGTDQGGTFLYWNNVYQDANTNKGYLLGNWTGRDGRGLSAQTSWWRSARWRLDFGYRQNRIGPAFLPGGGTQTSGSVGASFRARPDWSIDASAQYERYLIPVLGGPRHDLLGSIKLTYRPRWRPFTKD
jgi:membrane-associated phospholipid phosphatase